MNFYNEPTLSVLATWRSNSEAAFSTLLAKHTIAWDSPIFAQQGTSSFQLDPGHWERNLAELLLALPSNHKDDVLTEWTKVSVVPALVHSGWDLSRPMGNRLLPITYAFQSRQYNLARKMLSLLSASKLVDSGHVEEYLLETFYALTHHGPSWSESFDGRALATSLLAVASHLCDLTAHCGGLSAPIQQKVASWILDSGNYKFLQLLFKHDRAFNPNLPIPSACSAPRPSAPQASPSSPAPAPTLWWEAISRGLFQEPAIAQYWILKGANPRVEFHHRGLLSAAMDGYACSTKSPLMFWKLCAFLNFLHGHLGLCPVTTREENSLIKRWTALKETHVLSIGDYEDLAAEVRKMDAFFTSLALHRVLPKSARRSSSVRSAKL